MARAEDLSALIAALGEEGVEYVLVGGMAAVVHGAPLATMDVDIVHRRTPENVARMLGALARLGARYRGRPGGDPLAPTAAGLLGSGHHTLITELGPLDVLGELAGGLDYDAIAADAETRTDGTLAVRVVSLRRLIEIKSATNRAKDRLALPILLALLAQRER